MHDAADFYTRFIFTQAFVYAHSAHTQRAYRIDYRLQTTESIYAAHGAERSEEYTVGQTRLRNAEAAV